VRTSLKAFLSFLLMLNLTHASLPQDLINGDTYYKDRESLEKAYQALALYEKHLDSSPESSEGLWRASMANYYVGHLLKKDEQRIEHYRKGVKQGILCSDLTDNKKVECFFWQATNLALLKKEHGILSLALGIGGIIKLFEKALKIDSKYAGSGPYRMLALLYYKAPGFLGGDEEKAYSYIEKAIAQSPNEPLNYFFYIKFLKEDGENDKAMKIARNFTIKAEGKQFSFFESRTAYKNIQHFLRTKELPKKD
jgi:tetratricopeptide (TPR) repeat protein